MSRDEIFEKNDDPIEVIMYDYTNFTTNAIVRTGVAEFVKPTGYYIRFTSLDFDTTYLIKVNKKGYKEFSTMWIFNRDYNDKSLSIRLIKEEEKEEGFCPLLITPTILLIAFLRKKGI